MSAKRPTSGKVIRFTSANSGRSGKVSISYQLRIPAAWWLTSNQRLHWRIKAERTSSIRTSAGWWFGALSYSPMARFSTATALIEVHYPANRHQDPANAAPAAKAMIDGIVDAGVLPDDDAEHLTAVTYSRGTPTGRKGWYALTITLEGDLA